MKLICDIVNVLAMVMVLLLGAVSVHADEITHSHEAPVHLSEADFQFHPDARQGAQLPSDGAIHCGAPILGPEPMTIGCSVRVASVSYFGQNAAKPLDLAIRDLRPPRR